MEVRNGEVHVDSVEARAGSKNNVVRYILAISLALVVIAFTIIVLTGTMTSNQTNNGTDDSARAKAEQQATTQQSGPQQ
ncbi:sensor domain CHASE-containing protein [Novosphingobium chloroacetimidivorans]|uniref:Sensor domain CHASE-containing protein n=1 Tax=Novosphingobium chloroacetimidivorans TaxID=1428314 RepID=A0A7W7KB75_9SPHN|nr:hypothetical protein [Novosphingobium chloroacetimidivorans]MBB4859586.1 sensor domain CHASE-containing protein [Novosphingobium chloroacetimidivorans]